MFSKSAISLKDSGVLNKLVSDYLEGKEELRKFYSNYPDLQGFRDFLAAGPYSGFDRQNLSRILSKQATVVSNTSAKSLENITKLAKENSFTVTTGHQLCLFTGPLYFIYKIFSAINLAETLKKEFPTFEFIPVYWMASEDHDFDEVNHFHCNGHTVNWKSAQTGAVGKFETPELKSVLDQFKESLGISPNSKWLLSLFERAYLQQPDLAQATRFLVNELFGEYGLVIIDGDDGALKKQFKTEYRSDLFENSPYLQVTESSKALAELGYHSQVNPRPINSFYLEKSLRTRIEKENDVFIAVGTDISFTQNGLERLVENNPERISPNVVLRPLYQQKILPNIAYVGGPGELAYWLEFKSMFDAHKIIFPILVPRNFISFITSATKKTLAKLPLSESDFFKPEQEQIKILQIKTNSQFVLEQEEKEIKKIFDAILQKIKKVDRSLEAKVSAELQKTLNAMESIAGKANRAQRRKMDEEINHILKIRSGLFPGGIAQERYENFSTFYLADGPEFFKAIKEAADPFKREQIILTQS
jgi:bacillithiol biosynthesis cysteine-adding enzyme BshC